MARFRGTRIPCGPIGGSGSGERLPVSRLELFDGDMGVALRGFERGMSQQFLHLPQIRSPIEQVRRRAVT